jgi:predicted nucleotidyltransferase
MTTDPQALADIREITELIKEAVPVERIYLFGSYAYGEPNEDSDYDFFVVIPDEGMRALDAAMEAHVSLCGWKNRQKPVDILADHRSRFTERSRLNTMGRKIYNDGVMLYERA